MTDIILSAAVSGVATAASIALYLWCVRPSLGWRRARPLAYAVTLMAALAVPGLQLLDLLAPVSPWWSLAAFGVLLITWLWPDVVVTLTGGPRDLTGALAAAMRRSAHIAELLDVGAVDEAEQELVTLQTERTGETARFIGLWVRRVAEERERRAGVRVSSRGTLREIGIEYRRLVDPASSQRPGVPSALLVGLAAVVGISTSLVENQACVGVEVMLFGAEPAEGGTLPLADALPRFIEPGAALAFDAALGLDAAAESRSDPDTRNQLVAAEFAGAHVRDWMSVDGLLLQADVFEFDQPRGALAFQAAVNRYACQFANESFAAPLGGIGLQVRRAAGEPVEEQISWVAGNRRYLVSHRALTPPDGHDRVLRLFDAAEGPSQAR